MIICTELGTVPFKNQIINRVQLGVLNSQKEKQYIYCSVGVTLIWKYFAGLHDRNNTVMPY